MRKYELLTKRVLSVIAAFLLASCVVVYQREKSNFVLISQYIDAAIIFWGIFSGTLASGLYNKKSKIAQFSMQALIIRMCNKWSVKKMLLFNIATLDILLLWYGVKREFFNTK